MVIKRENYAEYVKKKTKNSPIFKNMIYAFLIGGTICTIGQMIMTVLERLDLPQKGVKSWTSIILIFLGAFLTGLGIYDRIAKYAGAGTIIPITGFSNSIASSAMEFKKEGFVLGVGAKIFTIAGPVLVYGTIASVVYGIIYWIFT